MNCTKLKIPTSSSELFNAFLHVIITRWLARANRNENVSFEKGPLDPNSTIPSDIKRTLYFIGKLCYKDLTQAISDYQFTDTEACEYLLDMQVIKDCGLFNVGKSSQHETFYLKHKQLQEYLAALYLSYKSTKELTFHELLYHEKNKAQTLFDVMCNIKGVRLVQFACGMSGEFLKSLLNIATSQFCLSVSRFSNQPPSCNSPNIYYESILFTEHHPGDLSAVKHEDLHGFTELKKYLLHTKIHQIYKEVECSYQPIPVFNVKCLHTLCGLFDKSLSLQLLSRFYSINVKPVGGELSVNYEIEGHKGSQIELCFEQLQAELLNVVCIHSVKSVRAFGRNVFVDIPGLLKTFPHLSELDITGPPYIPYSSKLRSDRDTGTSLTLVKLVGMVNASLPESHVHTLLLQTKLSHLELFNINIHPVLTRATQAVWSHLQHLSFTNSCKLDVEGTVLCHLLQSTRNSLIKCELSVDVVQNAVPLLEETLTSLTRVENLTVKLSVHSKTYNLCDTLQRVLPHLTTLHTLRVEYLSVHHMPDRFVDIVCKLTNIRTLWLLYSDDTKCPQQHKDKLTQCGVEVIA